MKQTFRILISVILVFCLSISAFAATENTGEADYINSDVSSEIATAPETSESQIQPRGKYTYIKNRELLYRTDKEFLEYVFGADLWQSADRYTLGVEKSYSASGSVEAGSINFKNLAKIAVGFVGTRTQTFSATAEFPADPSRPSNIAVLATYNISTCDLYETEFTQEEVLYDNYICSGTIKEPYRIYLEVCYEGDWE